MTMFGGTLGRLSTGMKMLLIMSAALIPLGLVALFASIESIRTNAVQREQEVRAQAAQGASQIDTSIARQSLELQQLIGRFGEGVPDRARCVAALAALDMAQRYDADYAIYRRDGEQICATARFGRGAAAAPRQLFATTVRLLSAPDRLRFEAGLGGGALFGVGEMPRAALADMARTLAPGDRRALALIDGSRRIALDDIAIPPGGRIAASAPLGGGAVRLMLTTPASPISALELLIAVLPLIMWLAAALIGWLVVDRLIIGPLLRIQRAIAGFDPAQAELKLPVIRTPARELQALGESFLAMTRRVATHEADLEAGLARQTRLTREVHHRVKNNLQVVSSLINLHARGVANPEVAAAYGSIQRRVDALAAVHRNHYAELEENRGVGLRALLGELAANLRATAPPEAAHLVITLDIAAVSVSQDVAVPVAFLVTEIVELAMGCDPRGRIAIVLAETADPARATLAIAAPGLASEACAAHPTLARFDRVIEGLSRQLRSKLVRDPEAGRFEIEIGIVAEE